MLSKEEILQFHQHGRIFRKGKLLEKIPFAVRTFTMGDNLAFAAKFDELKVSDTQERINNLVAGAYLSRCLVAFNDRQLSEEEIAGFSPPKGSLILETWNELTQDLKEYLEGYDEKPLDPEEVEEFILTDKIERRETLRYEDDVPPLEFTFRVLSIGEHEAINRDIPLKENISRAHADAIKDRAYAMHVISSINGVKVTEENIDDFSADLVGFILRRAINLEAQMHRLLRNPEEMGDTLKKS